MNADKQIKEILAKYGEDPRDATWKVQGTTVIYHKALERIAAKANFVFDVPTILRAERDEAVMMVRGWPAGDEHRAQWSIGEAVITDGTKPGNYKVSGRQAAYPYAMAEKRAKDRVILKLIGLHGLLYSEEEADEFRNSAPVQPARAEQAGGESPPGSPPANDSEEPTESQRLLFAALGMGIEKASDLGELVVFRDESIKPQLPALTEAQQLQIQALYKDRYRALNRRAA